MDRMSDRQLYSWALAAALAPGLFLAPAVPWLGVVLGVVVAGIFLWVLRHLEGKTVMTAGLAGQVRKAYGPVLGTIVLLLAAAAMAAILACLGVWCDEAFPATGGLWLFPGILLVLAATAQYRGVAVPARVGAILGPVLAAMAGGMLLFALPDVQTAYLAPQAQPSGAGRVAAALLLPFAALWLRPHVRSTGSKVFFWAFTAAAVLILASVVTGGFLGPALAAGLPFPLYTMTQSLRLFGSMERFEAVLSALMVAGFFASMMLVLAAGTEMLRVLFKNNSGRWLGTVMAAVGYGGIWLVRENPFPVFAVAVLLFCGLTPLVILVLVSTKKDKKV